MTVLSVEFEILSLGAILYWFVLVLGGNEPWGIGRGEEALDRGIY